VHYGQSDPPDFNLKEIKTKIALYVGELDDLAPPQDSQRLIQELPHILDYRLGQCSLKIKHILVSI